MDLSLESLASPLWNSWDVVKGVCHNTLGIVPDLIRDAPSKPSSSRYELAGRIIGPIVGSAVFINELSPLIVRAIDNSNHNQLYWRVIDIIRYCNS